LQLPTLVGGSLNFSLSLHAGAFLSASEAAEDVVLSVLSGLSIIWLGLRFLVFWKVLVGSELN